MNPPKTMFQLSGFYHRLPELVQTQVQSLRPSRPSKAGEPNWDLGFGEFAAHNVS